MYVCRCLTCKCVSVNVRDGAGGVCRCLWAYVWVGLCEGTKSRLPLRVSSEATVRGEGSWGREVPYMFLE